MTKTAPTAHRMYEGEPGSRRRDTAASTAIVKGDVDGRCAVSHR